MYSDVVLTVVKQHARLLLHRLQLLDEGAGRTARRRKWAEQASRADAKERGGLSWSTAATSEKAPLHIWTT